MTSREDDKIVRDFGKEWQHFDQSHVSTEALLASFRRYFCIFPWQRLPENARGFDVGCGSGRWAKFMAPHAAILLCLDASRKAVAAARTNLANEDACHFIVADVTAPPAANSSMDFGYCLGVLHHVADPEAGLRASVRLLKPGAPFLLYLYYRLENRPMWFRALWRITDGGRRVVSRLPYVLKLTISQVIAATVYLPLARAAKYFERIGHDVSDFPLSFYRNRTFYSMRTDALDRFGTRREKRFTKADITRLMTRASLVDIEFSDSEPYWCAVGFRAAQEIAIASA